MNFWAVTLLLIVATLATWCLLALLVRRGGQGPARWLVPALFGAGLLLGWEIICRGYGIPAVLLPAPSQIWDAFFRNLPMLMADFRQTFLKAVIAGFVIGNLLGFATALAGLVAFGIVVALYLSNRGPAYGWGWVMASLLVFSGTQLVMLGLIGEYLGRTFLTVNQRPQSAVRDVVTNVERTAG